MYALLSKLMHTQYYTLLMNTIIYLRALQNTSYLFKSQIITLHEKFLLRLRLTTAEGKESYEEGLEINCIFHSTEKPTYWPANIKRFPNLIDVM